MMHQQEARQVNVNPMSPIAYFLLCSLDASDQQQVYRKGPVEMGCQEMLLSTVYNEVRLCWPIH